MRCVQFAVAAFAAFLSTAAVAAAQPNVSVQGNTAAFSDQGPSANTDSLTVTRGSAGPGGSIVYTFTDNAAMLFGPGCVPGNFPTNTVVNCTVPGGTGVTVNVGDSATAGAAQIVTLGGTNWAGQVNSITGGPGDDELLGAASDDTLDGAGGADDLDGGAGSDTASYASATGPVHAQIDDTPDSGAGCPATCEGDTIHASIENLTGSPQDDVLTGTAGANVLKGGAGNDTLNGLAGDDTLTGDGGDDLLRGGLGADKIDLPTGQQSGQGGVDTLDYSQDGRTTGITTDLHSGKEYIAGQTAVEDTFASANITNIIGTDANDQISGNEKANKIQGMGGDDLMSGESPGSGAVAADEFFGGAGTDTVTYSVDSAGNVIDGQHNFGVVASIDDKANDGLLDTTNGGPTGPTDEGDNIHTDVENLTGTASPDTLSGSDGPNVLDGVAPAGGHDTASYAGRKSGIVASLGGSAGGKASDGDTLKNFQDLVGGDGDDTLIGDATANTLSGGPGTDHLVGRQGNDTLNGGAGTDYADYSQDGDFRGTRGVVVDLNSGTESGVGDSGTEDKIGSDVEGAIGTARDDTLSGSTGNDVLIGLAGADTFSGRSGNDMIDPGTVAGDSDGASDTITGGNGTDTVTYQARTTPVSVTPDGKADDGAAGEKDNVGTSVENVTGGSGNDTISADATATHLNVPNAFDGGPGNDTLTGLAGNDTLTGGDGNDTVSGDDGDDTLKLVDAKADTGNCGAGKDTVEADEGIDTVNADCETVKRTPVPPAGGGGGGGGDNSSTQASIVSIDNPSVAEGNSGTRSLVFTLKLNTAQPAAVSVPFATADLSAKAGEDYVAQSGAVAFAAGETVKTISVVVNGDRTIESSEQFLVNLAAPTGNAKLGSATSGVGTIVTDDTPKVRKKTPGLSLVVAPRRDRTPPYRFVATGRLKRPKGVSAGRGCTGKVRVTAKRGKKTVGRKTGFVDNTCHYTVPVAIRRGTHRGTLRFTARFLGNGALKAKTAKTATARAG